MKKLLVSTTKTIIPGNEALGKKEKTMLYIIIGNGQSKMVINVGQKTFDLVNDINELTEEELKKLLKK